MSLNATLSNALSGLAAAQRALSVTANNVANVNTEGYSRKQVNQEAHVVGGKGQGVRTLEPSRVVDQFLTGEVRRQENTLGRQSVLAEAYARLESAVLGAPGDADRGLSAKLGTLAGQLEQLANEPESRPLRTSVLGSIEDTLTQITADRTTVNQMRADADQRIAQTVGSINDDLEELHVLNGELSRAGGSADLADRRDLVLNRLAAKIDISTFEHANGRISVYTSGGQALLEQSPSRLSYSPVASMGDTARFEPIRVLQPGQYDEKTGAPLSPTAGAVLVSGGYRATITPELAAQGLTEAVVSPLAGGSLQGLIEVRDQVLPDLADQLGEAATLLSFNLNRAHNGAMPLPLPTQVTGSRDDFSDFPAVGVDRSGTASLAVFASDGSVAADITIDVATAASPAAMVAQIDTALGGLGTAQIDPVTGGLSITLGNDPLGEPYRMGWSEGDSSITVEDAAGHRWSYGFAHYFGLNDLVVPATGGQGAYAVRADIKADSSLLANAVMERDALGAPAVGGVGDKRGLQGLAAALDAGIGSVARGGLSGSMTTPSRYVSDMTALTATRAAQAADREETDLAMIEDLRFRQGAVSGVNLDEEMAKLVLYQQAYSVSARVIAVTNELFEELLAMAR